MRRGTAAEVTAPVRRQRRQQPAASPTRGLCAICRRPRPETRASRSRERAPPIQPRNSALNSVCTRRRRSSSRRSRAGSCARSPMSGTLTRADDPGAARSGVRPASLDAHSDQQKQVADLAVGSPVRDRVGRPPRGRDGGGDRRRLSRDHVDGRRHALRHRRDDAAAGDPGHRQLRARRISTARRRRTRDSRQCRRCSGSIAATRLLRRRRTSRNRRSRCPRR